MVGMRDSPRKADWPIIAGMILAVLVVALGGYVGGYFALSAGRHESEENPPTVHRWYRKNWQALLFQPAANVEGLIVGKKVYADWVPESWYPGAPGSGWF